MLTLLSECHFWTIRDEVRIKSNDYGAFRYVRQRETQQPASQELNALAKRHYTEQRNGLMLLKNSRKARGRLKYNLKKLEELLRMHKIVYSCWRDATQVLLLLSNGLIAHISVDMYTGDILRMVFEKYLVGKLAADTITDAFFTRAHIVLAYNTNQLTLVHLQKPNMRTQGPEKISNMEPRIFHVIIPGTNERKLARHLAVNNSFDLFVVWTKSSQNEVYPWRPTVRDQDRANIHIYKLKGSQLESICYSWSEHDPLAVDFLRSAESQILTVEQKVSRKGEITAEVCSYELTAGKMQRATLSSIVMGTQICCFAFSPDQEKLFLGSIDRNICMHDLVLQTSKFLAPIDIIPTQCAWHCDSSIVTIANDRAQFQSFDLALTPIGKQLQSEDVTPSNLLDLSHYFNMQPQLLQLSYSRKPELVQFAQPYAQTDCFLLLIFEHGPIGCVRFFAGAGMRGDIHNSGLTADVIVDKYLALNQLEKAVNLLCALNWETYGAMCLISLHKIANYVFFRSDSKKGRVELMSKALKTFTESLSEETKDEFSDQVFDLKRRFFFYLLRKNLYSEAFEMAQDVEDYDLFMDLHNLSKANDKLFEFSTAAFSQAAAILHDEERANGNFSLMGDYHPESIYSQSSSSNNTADKDKQPHLLKNYVPPLPSLKSTTPVYNAETIKINIPKPELRLVENTSVDRIRTVPPATADVRQVQVASCSSSSNSSSANTNRVVAMNSNNRDRKQPSTAQIFSNDNVSQTINNSGVNSWREVPDQTLGIPTILNAPSSPYVPSTAHNILPRASTNTGLHAQTLTHSNVLHHATPVLIAEQQQQLQAARSFQSQFHSSNANNNSNYQPKFYQHPLVSVNIPANNVHMQPQKQMRKPPTSILSNSTNSNANALQNLLNGSNGLNNGNLAATVPKLPLKESRTNTAETKQKVKFCDTVQVAVVPEISRKDKMLPHKRNGYARPIARNLMNPKKELADSLPLCHPNDDYLKDFNPISAGQTVRQTAKSCVKKEQQQPHLSADSSVPTPAIKVVHFGVV